MANPVIWKISDFDNKKIILPMAWEGRDVSGVC